MKENRKSDRKIKTGNYRRMLESPIIMKSSLTFLLKSREMQIKAIVTYSFIVIKLAKFENLILSRAGRDVRITKHLYSD